MVITGNYRYNISENLLHVNKRFIHQMPKLFYSLMVDFVILQVYIIFISIISLKNSISYLGKSQIPNHADIY